MSECVLNLRRHLSTASRSDKVVGISSQVYRNHARSDVKPQASHELTSAGALHEAVKFSHRTGKSSSFKSARLPLTGSRELLAALLATPRKRHCPRCDDLSVFFLKAASGSPRIQRDPWSGQKVSLTGCGLTARTTLLSSFKSQRVGSVVAEAALENR